MHLLLPFLLLISICANAQPGVELGVSGGPLFTTLSNPTALRYESHNKQAYRLSAEILGNKFSKPMTFSYGIHLLCYRLSTEEYNTQATPYRHFNYTWLMAAIPVGIHYKLPSQTNTAVRLSLHAGPLVGTDLYDQTSQFLKLYTSASVGLSLKRYTLGISASKIFGGLGDYNSYGLSTLQADVRMIIPSVNEVSPATRERFRKMRERGRNIEPEGNDRKHTAYIELSLSGGVLFPFASAEENNKKHITNVSTGYTMQWGFDVLNRKTAHKIKLSIGARLGQSDFSVKDSAYAYDGMGQHGMVVAGLHYVSNPASPQKFRVGVYAGGGLRIDGASEPGYTPNYYIEGNAVKYFTNRIGVGFSATYIGYMYASRRVWERYYSYLFNGFATSLDVRVCLGRNWHKR